MVRNPSSLVSGRGEYIWMGQIARIALPRRGTPDVRVFRSSEFIVKNSESSIMPGERELLVVNGCEILVSNPDKVLFPEAGHTKLDVVRYYLAVADGALRGAGNRPNVLVRYPNGIHGEFF